MGILWLVVENTHEAMVDTALFEAVQRVNEQATADYKALTRYRYKLTSMKSSEKNHFQNAFTVCNVALDSVVSNLFGKSATAIPVGRQRLHNTMAITQ